MAVTFRELRDAVQSPVRGYNDIAGILFGDHVSLPITWLFVSRGWSPTAASLLMLAFGLGGAFLLLLGDVAAVVGFMAMILYYVFDCVDGEVARYQKREKLLWGFHDYMFHVYVKSAFFLCLGIGLARATGETWLMAFAWSALLASFFRKALSEASWLVPGKLLLQPRGEMTARLLAQLAEGSGARAGTPADEGDPSPEPNGGAPVYGSFVSRVREIVTNLDLFMFAFLAAAVADLFVPRFLFLGVAWNLKAVLLVADGVLLPLDFLDRLRHRARTGAFLRDARRFALLAHRFRMPDAAPRSGEEPESGRD